MFMFLLLLMLMSLSVSFFEVLDLILFAFKLKNKRNLFTFILIPLLTISVILVWLFLMSITFSFPLTRWSLESDLVIRLSFTGAVIGFFFVLSTKLWMLEALNQFIRQFISVMTFTACWLVIAIFFFTLWH